MVYTKRLVICIILGFVAGILCYLAAKSSGIPLTSGITWSTIFNRIFIGFAIGVSAWRMHFGVRTTENPAKRRPIGPLR